MLIKNSAATAAVLCLLMTLPGAWSVAKAADTKQAVSMGWVDTDEVMKKTKIGSHFMKRMEADRKAFFKKNKSEEDKLKKEFDNFEKRKLVMSEEERRKKQEALQLRLIEVREAQQQRLLTFEKKHADLQKPLLDKIEKVMAEVAKKQNYDFIIGKKALLYGARSTNITSDVIKAVNKKHKR